MRYFHEKNIMHFDLKCEDILASTRDPHRPIWKAVVLFTMGGYGYGTYLVFSIRFSSNVEEKARAKDLHPKLLAAMFFFSVLGATGGVMALLDSDKPIFKESSCCVGNGFIGLDLLTLQTILPTLFKGNPDMLNVHAILGSGIMTLFVVHAVNRVVLMCQSPDHAASDNKTCNVV